MNVICLTVCHQTCLLPRLFMTNFALTSEFWIAILLLQLQSSFKQNRFNNVILDNNRLGEIGRKTSMLSWTSQLLNMKDQFHHLNFWIFFRLALQVPVDTRFLQFLSFLLWFRVYYAQSNFYFEKSWDVCKDNYRLPYLAM